MGILSVIPNQSVHFCKLYKKYKCDFDHDFDCDTPIKPVEPQLPEPLECSKICFEHCKPKVPELPGILPALPEKFPPKLDSILPVLEKLPEKLPGKLPFTGILPKPL